MDINRYYEFDNSIEGKMIPVVDNYVYATEIASYVLKRQICVDMYDPVYSNVIQISIWISLQPCRIQLAPSIFIPYA